MAKASPLLGRLHAFLALHRNEKLIRVYAVEIVSVVEIGDGIERVLPHEQEGARERALRRRSKRSHTDFHR